MKIKNNEKIVVTAVLSILVGLSYYNFSYKNQKEKLENLNQEKTQCEDKLNSIKRAINVIPKKEMEIKILKSKIGDLSTRFYPKIIQEKLILEIDKLMVNSNIIGNISFSDITNGDEGKKGEDKKESSSDELGKAVSVYKSSEKDKDEQGAKSLECMKMTIGFKGKYTDVLNFIKSIDEYAKKIAFTNLTLSQTGVNEVNGSMALSFYALPKIDDKELDYFNWVLNNEYGKVNVFDSASVLATKESIENAAITEKGIEKEKVYDFIMSLKPIQSDLPTVILGRAKDTSKNSYVYGDNAKEEKVEIYLSQVDGKYYFKYKTTRGSYPLNFEGKGEEFTVKGDDLNLKIYSTKRLSEKDLSSADIQIYNDTNKTLNVVIEDEDTNSPRAKITGNSGSIEVKKN